MRTKFLKIISLFFFGVAFSFLQPFTVLGARITDVRLWSAPDHTRIVIDLSEPIQYQASSQENPPQFHLELKGVSLHTARKEIDVKDPFITKISLTELGKDKVKLILHQKGL
jgi:N-acetylmuramoyl-L-alanine amidase